jgi:hypothetical protein
VQPGMILVPDLLRICQAVQDAVNRQAEAMRGGTSLRPGPRTNEVHEECTLALVGIEKGSTVLPFRLAKPQQLLPMPGAEAFGDQVIHEVVTTVKRLGSKRTGDNFESGVLQSLRGLGDILDKKRISGIEWIVPSRAGRRSIKAVFDTRTRDQVLQKIKAPSQRRETVEGVLEMADFKEQERRCRIHPPIGQAVPCTFDAAREEEIYKALRKPVQVTGMATINPNTGRIDELRIETVGTVDQLGIGAKDFFKPRSIKELAKLQGIRPVKSPKGFSGGWPTDQDVDTFLEEIYTSR